MELFVSMKVQLSTGTGIFSLVNVSSLLMVSLFVAGEYGVIDGAFGTSGKFRVTIPGRL